MVWDKIAKVLSNDKTWTVVSAIAGAIAAIAAMITIRQASLSMKSEREAKRPYFIVEKPGIKKLPVSPPYRMQLTLYNTGNHVASGFKGLLIMLNRDLSSKPQADIKFSVGNSIPPNSPTPYYNDDVQLPQNLPPQFIALVINYSDPILQKDHRQAFYMKWDGVKDGATHPDFTYASEEDTELLRKHLENKLGLFHSKSAL